MDILIDIRCSEPLDEEKIEHLASFVLSREHAPEDLELSISYVDTNEIQELNASYRGINAPTDVLSFECDSPGSAGGQADGCQSDGQSDNQSDGQSDSQRDGSSNASTVLLGDVIICPVIAREHALDFDSTFEHEMALMLTHGILHLLGYDHLDEEEAAVMEARENVLLAEWFASAK